MNKEQKFELDMCFAKQLSLLKDRIDELEADLYEYYDRQLIKVEKNNKNNENGKNIKKKISNLKKIKTDLIKIYSTIVSEYS
jgi:hypothetical protein